MIFLMVEGENKNLSVQYYVGTKGRKLIKYKSYIQYNVGENGYGQNGFEWLEVNVFTIIFFFFAFMPTTFPAITLRSLYGHNFLFSLFNDIEEGGCGLTNIIENVHVCLSMDACMKYKKMT